MVVNRVSNAEKQSHQLKEIERKFVSRVERNNLKTLSLDELAMQFDDIEQQAQLMQGQILLEARSRFPSDKEFGQWCACHSICVGSQQQRNRLIHLARFFEGRELDKIGISAAYEISAPINADVAEAVYDYARGKNLPVAEVKRQIAMRKGESLPLPAAEKTTPTAEPITEKVEIIATELTSNSTELIDNSVELSLEQKIMQIVESEIPQTAIVALKNVIDELNKKRYGK